jgi:outer membrane protein OmpA-like peptidoglycan-associated protein
VAVARPAPAAPAAASAPTAAARADGDWLAPGSHPLPFAFARGQSAPAVTDEQSVAGLVAALAGGTRCGLTLLGHTCADGDQKLNGYLGRERARATRALLLGRGVRSGLLATASAGGKHAAGAHESEEDHARDRRVSLEVTCR